MSRHIVAHLFCIPSIIPPKLKQDHHLSLDNLANNQSMVLDQVAPKPIQENDDSSSSTSTVTVNTPPSSDASDLMDEHDPLVGANLIDDHNPLGGAEPVAHLVPFPNSIFIIRSIPSRDVITLLDGRIHLLPPGGPGSIHWVCKETKGWLGFKNTVSGKFLGHDDNGILRCSAKQHRRWEYFCVRMRPEGGCVLMMTHYEELRHVKQWGGRLAKIGEGGAGGMAWEFEKV